MFLNDVSKKDLIREIVTQNLEELGIKYKPKRLKQTDIKEENKNNRQVFKVPLQNLPTVTVTLSSGQQLRIPRILHELCSFLTNHLTTEGLFRKEGSKIRQNEIKASLNKGKSLRPDCHEIDVAGILKLFLRELPESVIPQTYHDLFLRCVILKDADRMQGLLLACLLLPTEYLSTLSYLMHFFYEVANHSECNKMTFQNLAIIVAPNIFRSDFKTQANKYRLEKNCLIFQLLAQHPSLIGVLPQHVIDSISDVREPQERKKKRRSGSLTRVFSGLRKIVAGKVEETPMPTTPKIATPMIAHSAKKRKLETPGFSNKKKKELLKKLPEGSLLSTPYTPRIANSAIQKSKDKKTQWYSRNKSKDLNDNDDSVTVPKNKQSESILNRRWSAVTRNETSKKHKKRNSCGGALIQPKKYEGIPETPSKQPEPTKMDCDTSAESEYIRVSKSEYEEIKNKVSAIEGRLSMELDIVQSQINTNSSPNINSSAGKFSIEKVQTAYEQTLVQTQSLCPTSDHLARRLSRELKIRRSSEHRIIRSPSARKIVSLRRRSKEAERQNAKLQRNPSWHSPSQIVTRYSQNKRKTSLPLADIQNEISSAANLFSTQKTQSCSEVNVPNLDSGQSSKWTGAETFFVDTQSVDFESGDIEGARKSLVRLRKQNAGMVLAKARLFDEMEANTSLPFRGSASNISKMN